MNLLVMNSGSSSLKVAYFQIAADSRKCPAPVWTKKADIDWSPLQGEPLVQAVVGTFAQQPAQVDAVAHRIVHGGRVYEQPVVIDQAVRADIERACEFAPIHNVISLKVLDVAEKLFPKARQIAVFDTAFHATLKPPAYIYATPYHWYEQWGLRRYGFHGISHAYCTRRTAELVPVSSKLKIVSCHLGNGSSLCAIEGGISCDTTMGFTPLEGLMMGTRSGSVDPGMLMYVLGSDKMSPAKMNEALNYQSGLKGISGKTHDMRLLEEAMQAGDDRARLAFDMFIHRLNACLGWMIASLGGVDVISFTGGIGENASLVRKRAGDQFAFLGLELDSASNADARTDRLISSRSSKVQAAVIHADEERAMAEDVSRCFGDSL